MKTVLLTATSAFALFALVAQSSAAPDARDFGAASPAIGAPLADWTDLSHGLGGEQIEIAQNNRPVRRGGVLVDPGQDVQQNAEEPRKKSRRKGSANVAAEQNIQQGVSKQIKGNRRQEAVQDQRNVGGSEPENDRALQRRRIEQAIESDNGRRLPKRGAVEDAVQDPGNVGGSEPENDRALQRRRIEQVIENNARQKPPKRETIEDANQQVIDPNQPQNGQIREGGRIQQGLDKNGRKRPLERQPVEDLGQQIVDPNQPQNGRILQGGRIQQGLDQNARRQPIEESGKIGIVNQDVVDRAAHKLATDNRRAGALSDNELQRRLGDMRAVLGKKALSENLRGDLRRQLERDKGVLRAKVAEKEENRSRRKDFAAERGKSNDFDLSRNGRISISDLQRNRRRPEDLTQGALQKRILAVREQFNPARLSPGEREIVDLQLRQDRRALRNRFLEQRQERRGRLSDPSYRIIINNSQVNNTQINNTQINNTVYSSQIVAPIAAPQPAPSIPLAEAYDEQVIGQLTSPPVRPITQRYTVSEYRQRPELRDVMPAIELDTVKFGFNEDFLREEEVVKLDRIGEVLERIVAGSPEEVFLLEGNTDLVGSEAYNQDLSVRRASAVRQALLDYYYIEPKNLEIVGYGEQYPLIPVEYEEQENRRVTVRRFTPFLQARR